MRTFTLTAGTSDKFWSIGVEGADVTTHYGRNGTKGQVTQKTYGDAAAAVAEAAKQVAAKVKKGYVEGAAAAPGDLPAPRPSPAPAVPAPAQPEPEPAPVAAPAVTSSASEAPGHDPDDVRPAPAAPGSVPADLGVLLTRTEEAALAGGRPLDSLEVPEPTRDGAATATHAEAWLKTHAIVDTSYYGRNETSVLPPFDGLPDRRTAAWWVAFGCELVPRRLVDGARVPFTWEQWHDEAFLASEKTGSIRLDLPERRQRAQAAAEDPDAPLPLRRWVGSGPTDGISVWVALDGPASALDVDAAVAGELQVRDVPVLRALVVPQLPAADLERLREAARSTTLEPRVRLALSALAAPPEEHVALVDALGPEVVVEQQQMELPDGRFITGDVGVHWGLLLAAAVALPDPERRAALWDGVVVALESLGETRLLLRSTPPDALELEVFGSRALAVAADIVCAETSAERALFQARPLLGRLTGAGAVPFALRLATGSKAVVVAREWLVSHAAALASYDGPLSRTDLRALESVVREIVAVDPRALEEPRHPDVAALVTRLREESSVAVLGADGVLPDWWTDAHTAENATPVAEGALKLPGKLPAYAAALPPLRVADLRLDDDQLAAVLWSALRSGRDETLAPRPLVAAVRERMGGAARDAIALGLLEGYLGAGARSPEKALFLASGFLGADGYVAELAPLVRAWPGESQHQRAVLGLDALAATGTNAAMQAISGIAGKSKFKGVQKAANESLQRLADLQGLTVEEFEDRVVPDAGLDERGVRVLDYGPRRFRVGLGADGKPVVHALGDDGRPTGKPRPSLPAPNSKDDAELAAATKKEFSVLRKQLTDVASIQTARLERAMVTGRVWDAGDHATYVLRHPVLNALVRPLVWRLVEADGTATLVRVTEDREYVGVDEDPVEPGEGATIALAHPLTLEEGDKDAWRSQLHDYELTSPVEQLDRAVFGLPDGQDGPSLAELPTGRIGPGALSSTLERQGWRRGEPQDAGVIHAFSLALPPHGVGVVLEISDGLWAGMLHESGPQTLDAVSLVPLSYVERGVGYVWWHQEDPRLDWRSADPVVVSEVRRTLAAVEARMEDV